MTIMTGLFSSNKKSDPKKGMGAKMLKEFKNYVSEKKYDAALRCGSEYINKIGDHHHDLLFTMGAIYHMKARHTHAIKYLDMALEIGSYDTEALLLKARSHMILGQKSRAAESCKKIQEVDPKNTEAIEILDMINSSS